MLHRGGNEENGGIEMAVAVAERGYPRGRGLPWGRRRRGADGGDGGRPTGEMRGTCGGEGEGAERALGGEGAL